MQTITTIASLRNAVSSWRQQGETVALVATMGNLHEGHLCLVDKAREITDRVVVSIFVNPTQFAEGEDFSEYPRTVAADRKKLMAADTDLLFLPETEEIYPPGAKTVVTVTDISDQHCGASRPGHFSGVATIVCKLLNMVQPDVALFGEKDWQQLVIIKRMVEDLNIPVKVLGIETVRESDGLAKSSRNAYLTATERENAAILYQTLCQARDEIISGCRDFAEIEQKQIRRLQQAGFQPDYFIVCRSDDLKPANTDDKELIILVAAKLGKARLIDNLKVIQVLE